MAKPNNPNHQNASDEKSKSEPTQHLKSDGGGASGPTSKESPEPKDQQGYGSNQDRIVRNLLDAFWKGATGEQLYFNLPDRRDFSRALSATTAQPGQPVANEQGSNPKVNRPNSESELLTDQMQLFLQEMYYQIEDAYKLRNTTDGARPNLGRQRQTAEGQTSEEAQTSTVAPVSSSRTSGGRRRRTQASAPTSETATVAVSDEIVYTDEDLGISRSPQSYSYADAIALLTRAIRLNSNDAGRIGEILVRHVGPTIANARDTVTAETLVDGAIPFLRPLAQSDPFDRGVIKVIPTLRLLLGGGLVSEYQSVPTGFETLPVGKLETLTGLATLASVAIDNMSRAQRYQPWIVVYYHEVLRMLVAMDRSSIDSNRASLNRILENSANNIAAAMGRYEHGVDVPEDRKEVYSGLLSKLVQISVLLTQTRGVVSQSDLDAVAKTLGADPRDNYSNPFPVDQWANRLSAMHMVSVPENRNDPLILSAFRYAAVGLVREPIGATQIAGSAFFNAGVELLRVSDAEVRVSPLRAIVNSVGFLFALRGSENLPNAMTVNDGSDCLVNLFGSLIGLVERHNEIFPQPQVERLITAVQAIFDKEQLLPPDDAIKIERSMERMRSSGIHAQAGPPDPDIGALVAAVANAVSASLDLGVRVQVDSDLADYAKLIVAGFTTALSAFTEELGAEVQDPVAARGRLSGYLTEYLSNMMNSTGDPYSLLRDIYSEDQGGGTSIAKDGPLVIVGLQSEDEWSKACQEALGVLGSGDIEAEFRNAFNEFRGSSPTLASVELSAPEESAPPPEAPGPGSPASSVPDQLIAELARRNPDAARAILETLIQEPDRSED